MPPTNLEPWLNQVERSLNRIDKATERRLLAGFRIAQKRLLDELRRVWVYSTANLPSDAAGRERIARDLIRQLEIYLKIIPLEARPIFEQAIAESLSQGSTLGRTILRRYRLEAVEARLPIEAAQAAAANAYDRLLEHGTRFATKASQIIVAGVVSGSGIGKTTSALVQAIGGTAKQARVIARTETMDALDKGKRAVYGENGIEYVQRIETLDSKTCPWCAARHGDVYKLDAELLGCLHPNDRFVYVPFDFDWLENGLVDVQWLKQSRAKVLARLIENPSRGAAPFEKARGLSAPKPVWRVPE
jgi:SPP1 gp7 family putative phage head morphogenesis protein